MSGLLNQQVLLVSRPSGVPTKHNFKLSEASVPQILSDQLLIRTLYLSVDPYMRGLMNDKGSFMAPFALNEVITGTGIGEVVESTSANFSKGDIVLGRLGWQHYCVVNEHQVRTVDPAVAPITTSLSVLGTTGLTAYYGLLDIGKPKAGETVVVSAAAGAVGTVAGQIAKIKGARAVGIAGSDEKVRYLTDELGFDAAINYKTAEDIQQRLAEACPNGVDVYFDNVGGRIADSVLNLINSGARIAVCGQISQYNLEKPEQVPRVQPLLLRKTAMMQGFRIDQYEQRYEEGILQLAKWLREGKIKYSEHIVEGLENAPEAFIGLFSGENTGKQLIKV